MKPNTKRVLLGILAANAVGPALIFATNAIVRRIDGLAAIFVGSDFVLIPILMGVVTAYFWQNLGLRGWAKFGYSLLNLLVAILLSATVLREGALCLVMALPLVALFLFIGLKIGEALMPPTLRQYTKLHVTLVPFLLVGIAADVVTTHGYDNQVTDTITIHAAPQRVWRYITDYPAITQRPDYWLWRMGLPAPVQSTATGHQVGAIRKCLFTGNIAFEELITEFEPDRRLTFDVITQPKDPEVIGHFVLHKGQFVLHDNGDGTTTVTGTSWYTLNVHPAAYYDLWVQNIVSHVHLRVMEHIKALAEEKR